MKKFNITGTCIPEKNYMVDISAKLNKLTQMIEENEYFTINCARQYGKTTTLAMLNRTLKKNYLVISVSFEGIGNDAFENGEAFVRMFVDLVGERLALTDCPSSLIEEWNDLSGINGDVKPDAFRYLGKKITSFCKKSEKEVVLMIDEVDKSSDNQIFLNFLGLLRNKYLTARENEDFTFKSVILSSVYDIKNLKLKIRPDAEQKYNSPWNVAVDFKIDMSFHSAEIETMLEAYEIEHHTGMDRKKISAELYRCTGGYPFLISWLCKWIDEEGGKVWTIKNLENAQKSLLKTKTTLFDDLIKNVENHPGLKELISDILCDGMLQEYTILNPVMELGTLFGILIEKNGKVAISNRIFETLLYDYTISIRHGKDLKTSSSTPFIKNGKLDVPLILNRFQSLMKAEYRKEEEAFIEKQGRLLFLCFLKPIINGTEFYYVEPETRNHTRMDIVISYGGEEHIIELKIWHGTKYWQEGIKQLESYMDSREAKLGYLVSFSFAKEKKHTAQWLNLKETRKNIYEVVI